MTVFALLVVLPIAFCSFRPDLRLNRIDRYVLDQSAGLDRVFAMVPGLWKSGQPMLEVTQELERAGYRRYGGPIFFQEGEAAPADPVVYGKAGGGSGIMDLICSIEFLVIPEPDESQGLGSATGRVQSACL